MVSLPLCSYGFKEVNQNWSLDSDFTGSLRLQGKWGELFPQINLNGYKITIDAEGIVTGPNTTPYIHQGTITSNQPFLEFRFASRPPSEHSYLHISSVIADSDRTVGIRVTGKGDGAIYLQGDQSNTFTGNVEISGYLNGIVLSKSAGAIAVRGDILADEGALLRFAGSDQVLKSSSVTLRGGGRLQHLSDVNIQNSFKNLIIEDSGLIHFNHKEGHSQNSEYHIYVDDLIISEGGHLNITEWKEGRDHLLVRKDSEHLEDALKKISIEGWANNQVYLKSYNDDYWSIEAAPEPTTYGAILGTVGIALWSWRKKRRCAKTNR